MAGSAIDLRPDPALLQLTQAECLERFAVTPYECPPPDGLAQPFSMAD